jgi:hypothetical protein
MVYNTQQLFYLYEILNKNIYPSSKEKSELCRKTNLTMEQINIWFINQRRRHFKQINRSRFSEDTRSMLLIHFINNPFLGKHDIEKLKRITGLNEIQLQNWFSNFRNRQAIKDNDRFILSKKHYDFLHKHLNKKIQILKDNHIKLNKLIKRNNIELLLNK